MKAFKNDADDIMISSLVSLHMQIYAKKACCSSFQNLIFAFLLTGCGMTEKATCLQDGRSITNTGEYMMT
jgi:hypothetical protein